MDLLAQTKCSRQKEEKIVSESGVYRRMITVTGIVQGVGFRPFVYRIAQEYGLTGWVLNSALGVIIDVEGYEKQLTSFLYTLKNSPPPLARIRDIYEQSLPLVGYQDFQIRFSNQGADKKVLVPPDVAMCDKCRRDIFDSRDRHFHYPFTNCTNCGPRFTIVKDLPYDREQTSMADFALCAHCAEEYHNPNDRRFHAQPVACPQCGPHIIVTVGNGQRLAGDWRELFSRCILDGQIVGLRGLGGFHLVCDALNSAAVAVLRERKNRPCKPFAVMVKDTAVLKKYCYVSEKEENLLSGPAAPIVLLRLLPNCGLPANLAPGLNCLGAMLPYTPLHAMLFDDETDILVMTSGNRGGLPICKDNAEAYRELADIADLFVIHDREIVNRADDSVVRLIGDRLQYIRRSRGYVPVPVEIPVAGSRIDLVAAGGEMKNVFCLLKGSQAFMSQHIGEMDSCESLDNFKESLNNFQKLINCQPQVLGYDLHPAYQVSNYMEQLPWAYKYPIQHHHAHMAACLADNGLAEKAIGVILDGTGYGLDGNIWGFEVLSGDYLDFTRHYHLQYTAMPGGDSSVRNNWQMACSWLYEAYGKEASQLAAELFPEQGKKIKIIEQMIEQHLNTPYCSSAGRLFDALAALLNICRISTYEGQAATELAEVISGCEKYEPSMAKMFEPYAYHIEQDTVFVDDMFREIVADLQAETEIKKIVMRFHETVVAIIVDCVNRTAAVTGINTVVLSGGVFQNLYLATRVPEELTKNRCQVFSHCQVPANDGGLALGQAAIAYWRWHKDVCSSTGSGEKY